MKKSLLMTSLMLIVISFVHAQVTTSSMTGSVSQVGGQPTAGATVKATHVPSGTVYTGTSTESGRFNLANMRVGGPYRVEVTYVGQSPEIYEDIFLQLGQPYVLNVVFSDGSTTLDEVTVTAGRGALMNSDRTGATTTVGRTDIDRLPSINRSVNDLTRLTPQANGTAIGGGNYRSNNFMVDGANFNNQFGIGQNVPAGGSPISLDALEQISINVTPYDVRQSGFTGAAINAVTRSGRNDFFGTAFYTGRSDRQQGVRINDVTTNINDLKIEQFGVSLGGPIIKNKLFFFVNVEQNKTTEPGPNKVAATPGAPFNSATNIARPTAEFLDGVSQYLLDNYGYQTGPYQGYSNKSNNDKLFARLDWNIAENHKLNVRYSQVESKTPFQVSSSTSNSGISFGGSTNRQSINALHFANSNYFQEANLYSGTLEYNGKLGNLNHSLRASYVHQNDPRSSNSSAFPLVDILDGEAVLTTFGYEPFTYGNLRDVETYTVNYDASFIAGSHNLTGGLQFETSTTKNGFQRFGTGYYVFESWDDFVNNEKPINYALTFPLTADGSQAFPSFKFNQWSLYLQDEFTVSNKLKLTGGVRLELPSYPNVDEVQTHPLVAQLTFANGETVNTGVLPKARVMVSPRFGFNYDVLGDRSLQLRGGSGLFTGRIPFVWIVAQSGDAGMLQFLQTYSGKENTPYFDPNPRAQYPSTLPAAGTSIPSSISAMSPDLKFPQTWKSSLGVDYKLPYGIVATLEGIYNKDIHGVVARNVNLADPVQMNIQGYPDNRYIYPAPNADKYINKLNSAGLVTADATGAFQTIVMDNAKGGHYWSIMAQLNKQFHNGFSAMVAYTRSGARNFGDGSGDQIINLWSIPYQNTGNPNAPTLGYTDNVLPDRIVGTLTYTNKWIGNLNTSMTLFYSGSQQGRYSYYYTNDFNRDGQVNDLIYIPRDLSEIEFVDIPAGVSAYSGNAYTAAQQAEIFMNLLENDPYLSKNRGKYAERNGAIMPWRHQFDFRLSQQLFNGIGGVNHSLEFFWDIFNVGNLLNPSWGVYHINNNGLLVPQGMNSFNPNGAEKPRFQLGAANGDIITERNRFNETITSTYYMQFGLRYTFN
ncbi:TonB-dependent receptor [Parapedobacter sp. ISTM3]|uniref:TonB-dependent receptor n=1 Tax=Parapedobacter sp. ISTM3 TaxID=2800130 RepID=UPI0019050A32|nr:carboxypeptidase regulatory-like domain-containing protein [Parapedobacter sp. ISTM3]MBK1440320.1 TonB-dependent receptor [Parapedobacter sp. ISTM3]